MTGKPDLPRADLCQSRDGPHVSDGNEIQNDFKILTKGKSSAKKKYPGVNFVIKKNIYISKDVDIKPGVVLDASTGPIFIEKNVTIFPNAVIQGPFYIGESSKIKSCATIYPNVSIGKVCKIGGEVEDTVIHPYTNKQHSGFLGHSYLGSWINIGADTNNSDLQNNYGSITVQVNGKRLNSGRQFLGLMLGDHSKTAINTMFNTGTVVGSLSLDSAVYKLQGIPDMLPRVYPELMDENMVSVICLGHSRYSTNTLPSVTLSQPFSILCHNGEINTVDRLRDCSRAMAIEHSPGSSDSQSLNRVVEGLPL